MANVQRNIREPAPSPLEPTGGYYDQTRTERRARGGCVVAVRGVAHAHGGGRLCGGDGVGGVGMNEEQLHALLRLRVEVETAQEAAKVARYILDSGAVTNVTTSQARIAIRNAYVNLVLAAEELRKAQGVQP
jgi:hypothetical protein